MSFRPTLLATLAALSAAACGGDGGTTPTPPPTVESVAIERGRDTLAAGDSLQLRVVVRDGSAAPLTGRAVRWTSGDSTVLTVSAGGMVRTAGVGRATITATVEGRSGTAPLVARGLPWRAVAAGDAHTCGVRTDGRAYCWGENEYVQLGRVGGGRGMAPVSGDLRWVSLVAGMEHTCGITEGGRTACWGAFTRASLDISAEPRLLRDDPGFRVLASGDRHVCGLTAEGRALCWGWNSFGQLGTGLVSGVQVQASSNPLPVAGGLTFAALAPGEVSTCGATTAGEAYCWGDRTPSEVPARVAGVDIRFQSLVRGGTFAHEHVCGISGSDAFCWHYNETGEAGAGFTSRAEDGYLTPPVRVLAPAGVVFRTLAAGGAYGASPSGRLARGHTCGITTQDELFCWGDNSFGQLGDGTTISRSAPVRVAGGLKFREVSTRADHTCGITTGGDLYCWGSGEAGQLGDGRSGPFIFSTTPTLVL